MKKIFIIIFTLLLFELTYGQGLFESASQNINNAGENQTIFNGYVRGSIFCVNDIYDFPNAFGEISLQTRLKKNKFIMNSDIRFRSGYTFNEAINEMEIKEAYAGVSTNSFDILLGEQIISWGRTDGFNPTNNITPNNYFFFSSNPDDQKIPNFLLKTDFRLSSKVDWEIIAIPIFRPSMYRYELFEMGDNVLFSNAILPERTFKNSSLATRLNVELSGIGFSASWFRGFDPFYGFDLKNIDIITGNPIITYIPAFYKKNTFGVDFSLPAGTWIIRGEGAYSMTKNDDLKMYIPNDQFSYVAAIEHYFGRVLTIVQYVGNYTFDFTELAEPVLTDPMNMLAQLQYANEMINYESTLLNRKIFHQQNETNHAVSLTMSGDFAYETITAELSGYYNFTSEEYMIRPKLTWKIGGALSASAGYSYMKGPEKSVFGYASPIMNGAFIEFKANF